jgi:hypothetical protein
MNNKLIYLVIFIACLGFGCAVNQPQGGIASVSLNKTVPADGTDDSGLVFDPTHIDAEALPDLRDLPRPEGTQPKPARLYTGIIKNKTNYELSVTSGNSGGTLTIPARGWIEYQAWSRKFDLTAYYDGKPFYCLKIFADPKKFPFMCKNYDFIAEIEKPEPVQKRKPLKKRKVKRKDPKC